MTVAREWAIPVALGLVVAAGLWAVSGNGDDENPEAQPSTTNAPAAKPVLLAPFAMSRGLEGTDARFLLVAPEGQAAAMEFLNASGQADAAQRLEWTGGNAQRGIANKLAYYTLPHVDAGQDSMACAPGQEPAAACPFGNGSHPVLPSAFALPPGSEGPRLGLDGYNATRATIYVFDSRGLLAATNDAPGNWSTFPGAPTTMDPAVWYFGTNATAPNGTQKVPSFAAPLVQQMRPLMEGLPVGGVASAQSNAYVSLYGTLFITLRVDEIVYAP